MAWNTSAAKYRSTELAALDCAPNTRQARTSAERLWGSFTASASRVLGVGECVAMVRVPAGAVILGAQLYWTRTAAGTCVPTALLAVGDPFCCGRLLTAVNTLYEQGVRLSADAAPWGTCATMVKMGITADGCGIGYTYTCETDILLTNIYNEGYGLIGGHPGAYTVGVKEATAITSGKFTLVIDLKPV